MIQTNTPYTHTGVAVTLTGTLLVEITSWQMFKDFAIYNIEDSIILENGAKQLINSRQKRIEASEINQLDAYLSTLEIDFSAMTKMEREWAKAKYALLAFVQADLLEDSIHTIYGLLPENWVLSE